MTLIVVGRTDLRKVWSEDTYFYMTGDDTFNHIETTQ